MRGAKSAQHDGDVVRHLWGLVSAARAACSTVQLVGILQATTVGTFRDGRLVRVGVAVLLVLSDNVELNLREDAVRLLVNKVQVILSLNLFTSIRTTSLPRCRSTL